eukprot:TRINITY_DN1361_c0_g1_i2.p2 TRINITY_DN1361_c0_g1~~TRINITY_DN1361_c0_g1_i2.p2  ORF type:complete len:106 (-),score=11.82 TRINITY_DN1361_c0_g1_i2:162-479(-)
MFEKPQHHQPDMTQHVNSNDLPPNHFPNGGFLPGPRLCIYSRSDRLVFWEDVRDWIVESRSRGGSAKEIFLENSEHVKHALSTENYWPAIEEFILTRSPQLESKT